MPVAALTPMEVSGLGTPIITEHLPAGTIHYKDSVLQVSAPQGPATQGPATQVGGRRRRHKRRTTKKSKRSRSKRSSSKH